MVTSISINDKTEITLIITSMKHNLKMLQNNEFFDDAVRKSLNESERRNLHEILESMNRRVIKNFILLLFSLIVTFMIKF